MPTRTRHVSHSEEDRSQDYRFGQDLGFEDVTDDDIEDFLSQHEEVQTRPGFFNLPTVAGLATIGVGAAYLLERYDLLSMQIEVGNILGPWLLGVLIILLGFVFLSWKPRRERRAEARRRAAARRERQRAERAARGPERAERRERPREESLAAERSRRQFRRSATNRKLAGVCGGIGEYFGIDPTVVRIAFVFLLLVTWPMMIPAYLVLTWLMSKPEAPRPRIGGTEVRDDDRVVIIRS